MSSLNLDGWSPEQKQAILARGHNILVSAGAGSGKTSVLVERVISYLFDEPSTDVDQLLIVTFTEAAAAEMRGRIRNRLQKLLNQAKADENHVQVRQVIRQFSLLDQAQISTLHSFCLDVVRRNFLHLNFDPNFGILTEQETTGLREEIIRSMLEERLQDTDESAQSRFTRMLMTFDATDPLKLIPLVFRLDTFSDSQPNPIPWLMQVVEGFPLDSGVPLINLPYAASFYDFVFRLIDDASYALQNALDLARGTMGLESYFENIEMMGNILATARYDFSITKDISTVHSNILALLSLKSPRAKADAQNKDEVMEGRKQAIDLIRLLEEVISRGETELVSDLVAQRESVKELCEFVVLFKKRLMEAKQKRNKLYFSDLEHLAYEALSQEKTGEQSRLRNRYRAILIDEYQDTSPIQDAIVRKIVRDEGNLFSVGDVKQSIYRFRMAEPKLFTKQYESLGVTEPGEVIDLAANYRSRREIVACVNFVFSKLFTPPSSGFAYDERAQMKAGANYPELTDEGMQTAEYPIEFHLIERSQEIDYEPSGLQEDDSDFRNQDDTEIADLSAMEKEAVVIGNRILELTGQAEGSVPQYVYDKATSSYRTVKYRDIAILLRSAQGRSKVLLDILQAMSIPAAGIRTQAFFESLEVKWLVAALFAIHNPRRELELVTFLHSPLIGMTNEQLARIRTAAKGNFYDAILKIVRFRGSANATGGMKQESASFWQDETFIQDVLKVWNMFRDWRALAKRASASVLLRRLISDTGFIHYVTGMKGGQARKRNVLKLMDSARAYDRNSSDGLFGFLTEIESSLKSGTSDGAESSGGDGEDAVRIMTIHGSKGLEFPIVFVADLGKQFGADKGELQFGMHRNLGFGPVFYDESSHRKWPTVASIAISEQEKIESAAEEARILYVAMTRARERLIFVGSGRHLDRAVRRASWIAASDGAVLSKSSFLSARSYLDWLIPTFLHHDVCKAALAPLNESVNVSLEQLPNASFPVIAKVWNHPLGTPLVFEPVDSRAKSVSSDVSMMNETQLIEQLLAKSDGPCSNQARVEIVDSIPAQKVIPSKVSATELRRLWAAAHTNGAKGEKRYASSAAKLLVDPELARGESAAPSALMAGNAFHKLMQCIDLHVEPTLLGVHAEVQKLLSLGKLAEADVLCLNLEDVVQWLMTPLFARIQKAQVVYREQPFFHSITLPSSRSVIAQGVIDCLAKDQSGWMIVDYKTDNIGKDAVNDKLKEYEAQVGAYIAAVQSLIKEDAIEAYLYFVGPRATVRVKPMDVSRVFHP